MTCFDLTFAVLQLKDLSGVQCRPGHAFQQYTDTISFVKRFIVVICWYLYYVAFWPTSDLMPWLRVK